MHAALRFEALAMAFFAAMALAAPLTRAPRARKVRAALVATAFALGIVAASQVLPADVRLWLGHLYLVSAYRLPALLIPDPGSPRIPDPRSRIPDPGSFERWLIRTDERWRRLRVAAPVWAAPALELSYLFCYLVVPAAFLFVWTNATLVDADRFWAAVLLAGFACYGLLPWLISRPPRVRHAESAAGIRRLNVYILTRASHGLNTFPSGHVAVSVAAALAVLSLSAAAGIAAIAAAIAVAAGAVAGRYHYAVDVVLGAAVGLAAWMVV